MKTLAIDQFVTHRGTTRRDFITAGGALVVSFSLPGCAVNAVTAGAPLPAAGAPWPAVIDRAAIDSWIRIAADGSVTAAVGKIEAGMGIGTAFAQVVAEELDVPLERVTLVMGDTATTPDQRGTGGSNGIMEGGSALRKAAAEGRAALLALAAAKLHAPVEALRTREGFVFVAAEPARRVAYGDLLGGQRFDVKVGDHPKTKDARTYTVVGKPVPRFDIPPKVTGAYTYVTDLRVPGMLHGRVIRPPEAGAHLLRVDGSPTIAGLVRVVRKGDFLGVVCEREEQAIAAASKLVVEWSRPAAFFWRDYDELYRHLRAEKPKASKRGDEKGDVEAALRMATRVLEARYEYPFQSHASMGPACAIADVRDGGAVVWFGGPKPYPLRKALADLLALPAEKVRVIWMPGPGSYGMNDADDCAADAALLASAVGRPVRLQYMRAEGTGWDPKGPPIAFNLRAGINSSGGVFAWDYEARGFSGRVRNNGTDVAGDTLAGQLVGGHKPKSTDWPQFSAESYRFPNARKVSHTIDWNRSMTTGLRTAHLRDPDGMATCFASESFIDEAAFATGVDPVEFRLRYLADAADIAVVRAAAQKAGWQTRVGPRPRDGGRMAVGRGIAYAPRNGSVVAIVAEVEVDRDTGRYRVRRFTCAHDCGFVVNPLSLKGTIEANLIQGMSRAMHEAVRFDRSRVLSVDWLTYPIVDMTEVPDAIDIVLVNNRPEARSRGAGEPSTRPVAAAIANALFDATGARLRRVPLTPEALLAAMKA
ncbi:MAG: molybdopterin cofactor-binding domain-containing protein [Usitatibacter sp.]